ncbi:P2X purinoceptor 3-like [Astyanax mexicanus]|uniref:P2X purinoceptor n=1 Tax=Astyanax mexicanus TaxID=7994 RepID=A0A8T2LTS3_ASTMX|nr:P2X purinoceptor 3-like [Astyanax mexicanus]
MFCLDSSFFTYETTKSVVVKRRSLGIINRIAQALIIIYYVGYIFIHEKAYQDRDTGIESAVMTKVKGFGRQHDQLMDVADYVHPPQGAYMFCIITKMIKTHNQTQGRCHEADKKFNCSTDADCEKYRSSNMPSGEITGKCLGEFSQCEIKGWCPSEDDSNSKDITAMKEVENFTIFIKNSIRFPRFNVKRGNIEPEMQDKTCHYHPVHNTSCPFFRVGDVLKEANASLSDIINNGGEIGINIAWLCNLDLGVEKCKPKYSFTRLDTETKLSHGYNFRFAKYYMSADGEEFRTLHKAFAIRFDIIVSGDAGKFYIVPTLINIVAACTSVGLATVFCDIILLNFLNGSEQYKAKKFEEVSGPAQRSESHELKGSQITFKEEGKSCNDSGAYSSHSETLVCSH